MTLFEYQMRLNIHLPDIANALFDTPVFGSVKTTSCLLDTHIQIEKMNK